MYDKRRPKLNFLEVIRLEINTFKFNVLTQLIPWKFRRNIVLKLKGTKA